MNRFNMFASSDCDQRAWEVKGQLLIAAILTKLLKLSAEDVDRVRSEGHIFVNYAQAALTDAVDRTVSLVFCPFDSVSEMVLPDGGQQLFSFSYVVNMLLEPDHPDCDLDPFEHRQAERFDALSSELKLKLLMQFAVDIHPADCLRGELRFLGLEELAQLDVDYRMN